MHLSNTKDLTVVGSMLKSLPGFFIWPSFSNLFGFACDAPFRVL